MGTSLPGDDRHAFAEALTRLVTADTADDLCDPFVTATGVTGAAISTLGKPLGSQTVCASSSIAARIDEIQIDLGEGPCWDAVRTRRPILENDLQRSSSGWPATMTSLRALHIGSLYAFPLFVGQLNVGAVDLYNEEPGRLPSQTVQDVKVLAEVASRHLLRRALENLDRVEDGILDGPHSRREVHQATGMVAAQLSIGVDDALLVLRGRAFSSGRTLSEVSSDVVERRLTFDA